MELGKIRHLLTRPLVSRHNLRIVWRETSQLSLKIAVVAGLHRECLNEDGEVAAQNCPEDVGLPMAGLITLSPLSWLVSIAFLSFSGCTGLFFQPSKETFEDPERWGFTPENVELQTADGTKLHGWLFKGKGGEAKRKDVQILHLHGNSENISSFFLSSAWLSREGYDVFALDYRGYGRSEGKPNPKGVVEDAIAATRWLQQRRPSCSSCLVLLGQSLGGIIGLKTWQTLQNLPRTLPSMNNNGAPAEPSKASSQTSPFLALILDSTFDSYRDLARDKLASSWLTWILQPLAYPLVSNSGSPDLLSLRSFPGPVLLFHALEDPVVPYSFGHRLYENLGCETSSSLRTFVTVPSSGHIQALGVYLPYFRHQVLSFLNALKPRLSSSVTTSSSSK